MVQKEDTMAVDLTDEEYDALDEEMTKADLCLLMDKPGILTRQDMLFKALDEESANYIKAKSEELQKIPTSIIRDIIREKIAREVSEVSVAKV